ncbi:Shedu immune nuclease family protein [Pseudomonas batumici]|uniref:Shedu immune nuclease family protein n=1 Tax=Pseudomonas batumici TaxID=226910 RepID=UPI0030CABF40
MASISNSEYRLAQRTDGGPFAALLLLDEFGLPTNIQDEVVEVEAYYSDTQVPDGVPIGMKPWIRIMSIATNLITIWPVQQRHGHRDYGKPLFDNIDRLCLVDRVDGPYKLPMTIEDLDELLESLPTGFYKDWRLGLGLRWEFRSIITTIAEMSDITTVCFHGPANYPGTDRVESPIYCLGMNTFNRLRKEITAAAGRHQRAARKEKAAICHNSLLHRVLPQQFGLRRFSLPQDALADLTAHSHGQVMLTKRDQRAAVTLVQEHAGALVKTEPAALLRLKQDIELVTLRELIERCTELLVVSTPEPKWQDFLSTNPFILTMAFHYPVIKIRDQPYVGGKLHTGQGGSYSDFLMAAASTNNLALVEIKKPGIPLLSSKYRGVYPPSGELSAAVAQVVAQRAEFQASFKHVGTELDRQGYRPHSIACVVIIGLKPTEDEKNQGFEQYRHSLQGVHVVTFDELVERLQSLYDLLASGAGSPVTTLQDDEAPF